MMSRQLAARPRRTEAFVPEHARQQLAAIADGAAFFCEGVDAFHRAHQHAAQRSALRLHHAADKIRSSRTVTDWFGIQSAAVLGSVQELAQYLHDIALVSVRMRTPPADDTRFVQELPQPLAIADDSSSSRVIEAAMDAAEASGAATAAAVRSWADMMVGAAAHVGLDGRR
jgi:hypothetical protein